MLLIEQDVAVALSHADPGYVLEAGKVVLAAAPVLLESARACTAYQGLGAGQ